jgi:tRNA(fMet)-specific endonuclease VapC
MTVKYLLDTNVLSEVLKPKPNRSLLKRLASHEGELATSTTVWYELNFGLANCKSPARKAAIHEYLQELERSPLKILQYDKKAAEWQVKEDVRLRSQGFTRPFRDMQIAAVAKVHGLALITANLEDFIGVKGLQVKDWEA